MNRQTLYRFYDSANELLYIGISINAYERAKQHQASQSWWPEVAFIKLENFETRTDVLEAEKLAIGAEKPKYNIRHQLKASVDVWDNLNDLSNKLSSQQIAKGLEMAFKMWEQLKKAETR
jgi:predicted GIY-YIG superfamily endonuclease